MTLRPVPEWSASAPRFEHRDAPGVAVDESDRVYLLTRNEPRVIVYERDGSFVRSFGEGVFSDPHGISVGPSGRVYCVDRGDHTVRSFTKDGKLIAMLGEPGVASDTGFDSSVKDPLARERVMVSAGPFNRPTSALETPDGELYVTDGYANARVHRFTADGKLLHSWGAPGGAPGGFRVPHSVCLDARGRLLVADRENGRLQVFDRDGTLLAVWEHVQRPQSVASRDDGCIVVGSAPDGPPHPSVTYTGTESTVGRISILDPDGKILETVLGTSGHGAPGAFVAPHGIAVDSHGAIYIAENIESAGLSLGLGYDPSWPVVQKFAPTAA